MRKLRKRLFLCLLAVTLIWFGALLRDKKTLQQDLVRLHVVAASDSAEDQALKLRVRDAVLEELGKGLGTLQNARDAVTYLQNNLQTVEAISKEVLEAAGCDEAVAVTVGQESFPVRLYDTFRLPAGTYQTLQITIGAGEGQNWWCVVFPGLCLPATVQGFEDAASCGGFPESLTATLKGNSGYEIRFWVLDALGKLENFLCQE